MFSASMSYFGPSSFSMSICWLAFSASRMENAQSSISAISSDEASFTTRRMVRTPKAAWRASSCSTRRIMSVNRSLRDSVRSRSMMPTAVPSNRVCMPSVFFCMPLASSSSSSRYLSVAPIG